MVQDQNQFRGHSVYELCPHTGKGEGGCGKLQFLRKGFLWQAVLWHNPSVSCALVDSEFHF